MIAPSSSLRQTTLNFLVNKPESNKRKENEEKKPVDTSPKKIVKFQNFNILPEELVEGILSFLIPRDSFDERTSVEAKNLSLISTLFYTTVVKIQPHRPLLPYFINNFKGNLFTEKESSNREFIIKQITNSKLKLTPWSTNAWMVKHHGSLDNILCHINLQINSKDHILADIACEMMHSRIGLPFNLQAIKNSKSERFQHIFKNATLLITIFYNVLSFQTPLDLNVDSKQLESNPEKLLDVFVDALRDYPQVSISWTMDPFFKPFLHVDQIIDSVKERINFKKQGKTYKPHVNWLMNSVVPRTKNYCKMIEKKIDNLKYDSSDVQELLFYAKHAPFSVFIKFPELAKQNKTISLNALKKHRDVWSDLSINLKFDDEILCEYLLTDALAEGLDITPKWFSSSQTLLKKLILNNKQFPLSWISHEWADSETQTFIAYCAKRDIKKDHNFILFSSKFSKQLKDKTYTLKLMEIKGSLFQFVDSTLRKDEDVIKMAISTDPAQFKNVVKGKYDFNKEFYEALIETNPLVFKYIPNEWKTRVAIAVKAIKGNYRLFEALPLTAQQDKEFMLQIAPYLTKFKPNAYPPYFLNDPKILKVLGTKFFQKHI